MTIRNENYNNISCGTEKDHTEGQSVCRIITISVLTLNKIKLNSSQGGELQPH